MSEFKPFHLSREMRATFVGTGQIKYKIDPPQRLEAGWYLAEIDEENGTARMVECDPPEYPAPLLPR